MRLIDVENYCANICRCNVVACDKSKCPIWTAPTVDPKKHERTARWDDTGRYRFVDGDPAVVCTHCGAALTPEEYETHFWYYCPVCGFKMIGGKGYGANEPHRRSWGHGQHNRHP